MGTTTKIIVLDVLDLFSAQQIYVLFIST